MKPLSELVKELRKFADSCDERGTNYWHPFGNGVRNSANLLQAWLREADEELLGFPAADENASSWIMWIRDKVLGTYPGTTQKPKQEGER